MFNIPENTYVEPIEVRENVLECIVDALLHCEVLRSYSWDDRFKTTYVSNEKNSYGRHTFEDTYNGTPNNCTRIRTCEVKKAFELLVEKGYFIYRYHDKDETTYQLRRSGAIQDKWLGRVVTTFTENIDH